MFLENFNIEDPNEIERLFEYLEKDKFSSLSFDEQDELLDFLIDCTNGKMCGSNKVTTIGLIQGSKHGFEMSNLIDEVGKDKLKDILREAILSDQIHMNKIGLKDVTGAVERLKNGTASEEDMAMLDSIIKSKTGHPIFSNKDQKDVDFSTFAIIKAYCAYFDFEDPDDETEFIKDIEPLIQATYCIAMAGIVSDSDNPVGKMFMKHGYFKVQKDIIDLTLKFSDLIVNYSKDNLIAPEKTFLALLNVLKIISGPLNISLDNYNEDKLEDALFHIMFAENEKDHEDIDNIIKDSIDNDDDDTDQEPISDVVEHESDKSLANANKKESKSKPNIRKLLLDD